MPPGKPGSRPGSRAISLTTSRESLPALLPMFWFVVIFLEARADAAGIFSSSHPDAPAGGSQLDAQAPIWRVEGFLTDPEVDHVLQKLPPQEAAWGACPGEEHAVEHKKCTLMPIGNDTMLHSILKKISSTWDLDVSEMHSLPVAKFLPGAPQVKRHTDHTQHGVVPDRTLLIRLTQPAEHVPAGEAGELVFPNLRAGGLTVRPSRGELVAFVNIDENGADLNLTEHTVHPLASDSGEKISLTLPITSASRLEFGRELQRGRRLSSSGRLVARPEFVYTFCMCAYDVRGEGIWLFTESSDGSHWLENNFDFYSHCPEYFRGPAPEGWKANPAYWQYAWWNWRYQPVPPWCPEQCEAGKRQLGSSTEPYGRRLLFGSFPSLAEEVDCTLECGPYDEHDADSDYWMWYGMYGGRAWGG